MGASRRCPTCPLCRRRCPGSYRLPGTALSRPRKRRRRSPLGSRPRSPKQSGCRAREGRRHDHRRVVAMQSDSAIGQLADSEWAAFIVKLEAAEHEFALGRPAAFKALWSQGDEVSICGAFGDVQSGREKVAARLDWASSQFSEGIRSREEISSVVRADFAYIVQTELIRFGASGRTERGTLEMRVTMVFRREADGWRIVHRHADSQTSTQPPK